MAAQGPALFCSGAHHTKVIAVLPQGDPSNCGHNILVLALGCQQTKLRESLQGCDPLLPPLPQPLGPKRSLTTVLSYEGLGACLEANPTAHPAPQTLSTCDSASPAQTKHPWAPARLCSQPPSDAALPAHLTTCKGDRQGNPDLGNRPIPPIVSDPRCENAFAACGAYGKPYGHPSF